MKNFIQKFTHQYPVIKTLQWALKPQMETLDHISKQDLISEDENLSKLYKKLKKLLDQLYRKVIEEGLKDAMLSIDLLNQLEVQLAQKKSEQFDLKKLDDIQRKLRSKLINQVKTCNFLKDEKGKSKFKDYLFKKDIIPFLLAHEKDLEIKFNEDEINTIQTFEKKTTRLQGFFENRQNVFSDEAISTSIAYRTIHQNIPTFLYNRSVLLKISILHHKLFVQLEQIFQDIFPEDSFLKIESANKVLNQKQIEDYNEILGGYTTKNGQKIQGLNELINLYRQKNKLTKGKIPNLKPLYKQILANTDTRSFVLDKFNSKQEVLEAVNIVYKQLQNFEISHQNFINCFEEPYRIINHLLDKPEDFKEELNEIYISKSLISKISCLKFDNPSAIRNALFEYYSDEICLLKKSRNRKQLTLNSREEDKVWRRVNEQEHIFIDVVSAIDDYDFEGVTEPKDTFIGAIKEILIEGMPTIDYNEIKGQFKEKGTFSKEEKEKLKALLDSWQKHIWSIKDFLPKNKKLTKSKAFYNDLDPIYNELTAINHLYNKTRNFVTQKETKDEKFKLEFNINTLANGWAKSKETTNKTILFMRADKYYLGIFPSTTKPAQIRALQERDDKNEKDCYQKMNYYLLPGANKMLPKVIFSKKNIDFFRPNKEILEIREKESFKKGDNFNKEALHKFIDFYKRSIKRHIDWKIFDFQFSETSSYQDISGFYREVEKYGYKLTFNSISESYIKEQVKQGHLYLFEIYSKDFSNFTKGAPNLFTIYWRSLFERANLKEPLYKLNGEAELFYRKASIKYKDSVWEKGHHAEELKGKFNYPIISKRRFARDQFLFHVPITLNFGTDGTPNKINDLIRYELKTDKSINIIGIDRGERNLLYISVINQKGEILKQQSLNIIDRDHPNQVNKTSRLAQIDYLQLLKNKEEERGQSKKDWDTIEKIKDLKEGYLSHVVYIIVGLVEKYNAIVVLENLNSGFKRSRIKIERQVYQKFEKSLIEKLNFLVIKTKGTEEFGSHRKAYQLTNKFESFAKLGIQSGILFYVDPYYTSKIDPTTGFINPARKSNDNQEMIKAFFGSMTKIIHNSKKERFEFHIDKSKLNGSRETGKLNWVICADSQERYIQQGVKNSTERESVCFNVYDEMKKCLNGKSSLEDGIDIWGEIKDLQDASFFQAFYKCYQVLVQLRYTKIDVERGDEDYILSPVENKEGNFYDSRVYAKEGNKALLPVDSDANGAYHIAKKGQMIIERIQKSKPNEKLKFSISLNEWLDYIQR